MGSAWGNSLKISIFGESHGTGIGVVLDGFPTGVSYDAAFIQQELTRRAPGRNAASTQRKETDIPRVLSGVFDDTTSGAPLCAMFQNSDTHSGDYSNLVTQPRPAHADYTGKVRFNGCNDPRGGGHFSGRLTAPMVYAGAVCKLFLASKGITIGAHIQSIAQVQDNAFDDVAVTAEQLLALREQEYPIVNPRAQAAMLSAIEEVRLAGDSVGGVIECAAVGVPVGLGSPMLQSAESRLSSLLFSIPAVKGVEFGVGFGFADYRGSVANDAYCLGENGEICTETNNNGGMLGGITTGMPLLFRTAFKPTPSIGKAQHTLNLQTGEQSPLVIHGRHDPCIVTRAAPVVEAACAIALTDMWLEAYGYANA